MAASSCNQCGAPLGPAARFCGRCGAAVAVAAPFVGQAETDMMYGRRGGIRLGGEFAPYAGFWPRFLAWFIDGIVVSIVTQPILLAIGQGFEVEVTEDAAGNVTDFSFDIDPGLIILSLAISTLLPGIYYIIAVSKWGQTLGALALSLKIVHPDGSLLSPALAAVRWIGSIVSSLILLLGYFWMIWDHRKQTWHDKMAGSVVVKVKRPGEV
jgi:uncharacterized RDD family membrane protein YckC